MNGPDPRYDDHDPFTQGHAPQQQQDFSAYEDPLPDIGGNDAETIRKINRRTSPFGRIAGVLIVAGAVGLGYWAYKSSISYDNRMDALNEAGKLQGEPMLASLRAAYASAEHEDVKERILLNLGAFKDPQGVPLMIEGLNQAGIVRRAAARALANIGSPAADPAKPKLLEVLPKTDTRDRAQVVWTLAVLKEQAAVPEILSEFAAGRLQNLKDLEDKDAFDPKVITDVVGPQKLASDELIKNKDKAVRALVAMALAEAATPEAVDPLVKLLEDPEVEVVRAAAAGLGRTGDPRAAAPLFALLQRNPSMRQSVLDSIGRSTSAPGIVKLLETTDNVDLTRSLVSTLKEMHDPRVADAFAKLLGHADADIKQTSALALAELGDARAVPVLIEQAQSPDRNTALDALDALAMVPSPEVADALIPLLKDNPGRKAGLLKAIGKSGSPTAGAVVMKELTGDDIEAAAFALGDLKYEPAYSKLLGMVKKPPNVDFSKPSVPTEEIVRNREIAIRALGRYGKPQAAPALATIIEDPADSAKLRAVAGAVLGQIADAKALGDIVAKAKNNALDESTRTYYVQGLWQADAQTLSGQLTELLQPSVPAEVRRSAALAIGYAADPANDQLLIDLLRNPDVKREAAFAVVLGGSPQAAEELYKQIGEDRELREVLQDFLMADDTDFFNVITARNFESGQIFRRLKVADILKSGQGEITFSFPWQQTIARLKAGYAGPGGLTPREIRAKLYAALRGEEPEKRRLAAAALGAMGERGLLLASRDEPGAGQQEARELLVRQNRATSAN
jgi:HEAT repeat protein